MLELLSRILNEGRLAGVGYSLVAMGITVLQGSSMCRRSSLCMAMAKSYQLALPLSVQW